MLLPVVTQKTEPSNLLSVSSPTGASIMQRCWMLSLFSFACSSKAAEVTTTLLSPTYSHPYWTSRDFPLSCPKNLLQVFLIVRFHLDSIWTTTVVLLLLLDLQFRTTKGNFVLLLLASEQNESEFLRQDEKSSFTEDECKVLQIALTTDIS